MNAMTEVGDDPLPETIADTNDAITDLTGQITSLHEAINLHHERHRLGLVVDWSWHHRAKTKLGFLKGEKNALRRHLRVLEGEARVAETLHHIKMHEEISRKAAEAKAARVAANNTRNDKRQGVGIRALRAFIAARAPHLMAGADAAMTAAQAAFDLEFPPPKKGEGMIAMTETSPQPTQEKLL